MNVDREAIISLLNPNCVQCDVHFMRITQRICTNCPFTFPSKQYKEGRFRPGCKFDLFRSYGMEFVGKLKYGCSKTQLLYLLYHPELNWEIPIKIGNYISEIHHINGHYWDDTYWNLMLTDKSTHKRLENTKLLLWNHFEESKFFSNKFLGIK
jgi:hypothetical protein